MKLIGVSGKAASGKDTFAMLAKRINPKVEQRSFAGALKEEVAEFLTRCEVAFEPRHLWGNQKDKEATLRISHHYANACYPPMFEYLSQYGNYHNGWWYFQPRTLLQHWGTEYRRSQNPDYWIELCLAQCTGDRIYIITDVRYPNEARAIQDAGGILVRIKRKDAPSIANGAHPSETALDAFIDWDYTILNNSTLEYFGCCVADILWGLGEEQPA